MGHRAVWFFCKSVAYFYEDLSILSVHFLAFALGEYM
jgi:hypothetical protein